MPGIHICICALCTACDYLPENVCAECVRRAAILKARQFAPLSRTHQLTHNHGRTTATGFTAGAALPYRPAAQRLVRNFPDINSRVPQAGSQRQKRQMGQGYEITPRHGCPLAHCRPDARHSDSPPSLPSRLSVGAITRRGKAHPAYQIADKAEVLQGSSSSTSTLMEKSSSNSMRDWAIDSTHPLRMVSTDCFKNIKIVKIEYLISIPTRDCKGKE